LSKSFYNTYNFILRFYPLRTAFLGPGLTASKPFSKGKMSLNAGGNYNRQSMNSVLASHIMNWRLGLSANPELFKKESQNKHPIPTFQK
jgi:hypothetical protein